MLNDDKQLTDSMSVSQRKPRCIKLPHISKCLHNQKELKMHFCIIVYPHRYEQRT